MRRRIGRVFALLVPALAVAAPAGAQGCAEDPAFATLDFWVGLKEKTLVERLPDGGVRFQGEIPLVGGGGYLDRTTLTPAEDGTVRQVIERSTDGGETWASTRSTDGRLRDDGDQRLRGAGC